MPFFFLRVVAVAIILTAMSASLQTVQAGEPLVAGERRVIELDAPWVSMTTGGAGRYIVLHLKDTGKLVLLDIAAAEIIRAVDAPGEDLMLAGGLDKLIVLVPSQGLFHRYDLATLTREKSFPAPSNFHPKKMAMGSASQGPLVCHTRGPIELFDIQKLKPINLQGETLTSGTFGDWGYEITVSGDGQTVVGWIPNISGQQYHVMRLSGNRTAIAKSQDGYSYGGRYLVPNADASLYFRDGSELFDANLKPLATDHLKDLVLMPCDDPSFFLAVQPTDNQKNADAWICASGTLQKIAAVTDVGHVVDGVRRTDLGHWQFAPRVKWLPAASTLASLPQNQKEVLLVRANLKELLQADGGDYLHIVSSPPRTAYVGKRYTYQIDAISSGGQVTYEAASMPDGMKISPTGLVEWTPRTKAIGGEEQAVIIVSAGGQEAFHRFAITVERSGGPSSAATSVPPRMTPGSSPSPMPTPNPSPTPVPSTPQPAAPQSSVDKPILVDDVRLEIPTGEFVLTEGANFRHHLLLQGNRLTILAADGITPEQTLTLDRPYVRIAEREGYYVAVSKDPFAIEQIDKQTMKVTKSVKFVTLEITDLVLHPTLPLAYVAHKKDISFPRYRFLMYDEAKGKARASDDYLGTFLKVDPSGRYLIAGYRDIYENGSNFIFNPDRIHVVPSYGSVDWLMRYDLDRQGLPTVGEIVKEAGGNGKGIRLSRDGKRVSYLSVVGSPPFSRQLCGWDVYDLEKFPPMYDIKDKATTEELAYHPFLSWVACQGGQGNPLLFDRESGDPIADKIASFELGGAKVHGLSFAADGKAIVLDTSVNGIHYLHRVTLKLASQEEQTCDAGYKQLSERTSMPMRPAPGSQVGSAGVPLAALQALRGGTGEKMTARDVAQQFTDAVVVIKNGSSSGTGMVVGADGYILTCAHCVSEADTINVSYRRMVNGQLQRATAEASLLQEDQDHDLAMLKIEVPAPLSTVCMGSSSGLANGERSYVIGNPGVGATTFEHTITEGIISSAGRQIDGNTFIQTSASINPGSSGSPLFNENGLVVGQVVLKAKIEGAGFATPSDQLIRFLVDCVDMSKGWKLQRQWIDSTGAHRVDAALDKVTPQEVVLKRANGAEVVVPLTRLSKADRGLVQLLLDRLPR
ncbi:S1C family serine protease [Bremerella sp.]|uniref:S1C family serine protease n=1 Tax=Bremerella sp. TaxID=2795602 RepID=UPI003918A0AC